MNDIKSILISDPHINDLKEFEAALPPHLQYELQEYIQTGQIQSENEISKYVPKWIHNLIKYEFVDISTLKRIVKNQCDTLEKLISRLKESRDINDLRLLSQITFFNDSMNDIRLDAEYINNLKSCGSQECTDNAPLRGTLHNHTQYSDGLLTIEEYIEYGLMYGFQYIGVSDHTRHSLSGISNDELLNQAQIISDWNSRNSDIKIMHGIECEVMPDGSLDIETNSAYTLDYIIIGTHQYRLTDETAAMQMLLKAIENPLTDILAHPSARTLNSHPGMMVDLNMIIDACVANNVVIELNLSDKRIDLPIKYIDYALNRGGILILSGDIHRKEHFTRLLNINNIIADLRIPHSQLLNTFDYNTLIHYLTDIHNLKR